MKNIIKQALERSISYLQYKELLKDLLSSAKSTGEIQTLDYLNYSKLGVARMKRLDKTYQVSLGAKELIMALKKKQLWLVLSEGWCGDAAHALPVMYKMAEVSPQIELKIVLRDENKDLMDLFLTNSSRSIPKLIVLDPLNNEVLSTWGPRPSIATKMVTEQKARYNKLDEDFKKELQIWYNSNKGKNIESDLLELISSEVNAL